MKIYSKFNDYYDSVQTYGQDPNVVYKRKTQEVEDKELFDKYKSTLPYTMFPRTYRTLRIRTEILLFCGQRINVVEAEYWRPQYQEGTHHQIKWCYSLEELDAWADKLKLPQDNGNFFNKAAKLREHFAQNFIEENDHFVIDSPIILITKFDSRKAGYIKDLVLKDKEFQKVKDPYTAFQELDMFISGVMGGKSPRMESISDENMKIQKGFGHKYAFKKEPESK